jgi:hypothetical protein
MRPIASWSSDYYDYRDPDSAILEYEKEEVKGNCSFREKGEKKRCTDESQVIF